MSLEPFVGEGAHCATRSLRLLPVLRRQAPCASKQAMGRATLVAEDRVKCLATVNLPTNDEAKSRQPMVGRKIYSSEKI